MFTRCVWLWGLTALTQMGRPPDLLLHTPSSTHNSCHGLPSRFWELHIPEYSGLGGGPSPWAHPSLLSLQARASSRAPHSPASVTRGDSRFSKTLEAGACGP